MNSSNQLSLGDGDMPSKATTRIGAAEISRQDAPRVLIVEDELFVAWHLETLVRDLAFEVVGLVPDGEGAIEQAGDFQPDLILMDISLSGEIDGIEAARRIRERAPVPIVFITAYTDAETRARIERAAPGALVLAKPISADHLRRAIDTILPSAPR